MRSLPQVTIRPLDVSMSMWLMLCFPSWNVASGVRLRRSKHRNLQPQNSCKGQFGESAQFSPRDSLFLLDGADAVVADPHRELEAHDWIRGALGAALPADGLPALPAVVLWETEAQGGGGVSRRKPGQAAVWWTGSPRHLSEAQGFGVPHLLDVPEERLLALLAGVAVQPLRRLRVGRRRERGFSLVASPAQPLRRGDTNLFPLRVHVPDGDASIGRARQQLPGELEVAQRLDTIAGTQDRKTNSYFSLLL